jgi:quercetin dioxygenase-like cupin family protein
MSTKPATIVPAQALDLRELLALSPSAIASRVLARTSGGNVTLFAFDGGQELAEHTAPFDALVIVLEGALLLTIGGVAVRAMPGSVVRMPAGVAHAVQAEEASRMLLVMLRELSAGHDDGRTV